MEKLEPCALRVGRKNGAGAMQNRMVVLQNLDI